MLTADGAVIDRVSGRECRVRSATVEVRGHTGDLDLLIDQVVVAISVVAAIAGGEPVAGGVRLGLEADAVVRILAGTVAWPESRPTATIAVTVVVDDPGTLPETAVGAVLGAVDRVAFTELEWAELVAAMPLTHGLPAHLPPECLARVAPVFTVHHMTDFLVMVEAAQRMGVPAEGITVIDKGYRYRHTHRVDAHLRAAGIAVFPWTRTAEALADHAARARRLDRAGLLIDDGGYTLPVLLDQRPDLLGDFVGLVEQTTSGITKLERYGDGLPVPVLSVAESRLKATIESYGIADAAVRNVLHLLPQEKFEGQAALVLGFGRIGEQVAEVLRDRRMRVAVYDQAIVRLIAAHERGFLTARSLTGLLRAHRPLLIFGSTGRTGLRGEHAAALVRDCYLVSTTSRTHEFALDELAEEAVTISDAGVLGMRLHLPGGAVVTVVGDGFPINFHYAESMPNKYADLVLASLLVGAATLAAPDHAFVPGHNVAATDAVLEGCGLLERYYQRFGPGSDR
jgi:S-adenosylhomocysteine hydrolase